MKQITFPKGSITINKIPKDLKAKPLAVSQNEIEETFKNLNIKSEGVKTILKEGKEEFNYEIIFNHPKWSKLKLQDGSLFGDIKIVVPKLNSKKDYEDILTIFKERKESVKEFKLKHKSIMVKSLQWKIQYNKCAGVIHMPELKNGVYLQFLKDQEKRVVFKDKVPTEALTNYVGIELEFIANVNQEKLGFMLYDAGLGKYVKLTTDGSLRCTKHNRKHGTGDCDCHKTEYPHELCVIAKESERKEILKKVCEVLSKVNARINKSCGLHVHLDMRNRNPEQCYQNLISGQHLLYKMNPKSRSEIYARKTIDRDFEKVKNTPIANMETRYLGINPMAYNKHKTLEVRIHSGTIEFTKIDNWINILLNVVNTSDRIMKAFVSLNSFCETFDIHTELKAYMKERIDKFNPKDDVDGMISVEPESGVA